MKHVAILAIACAFLSGSANGQEGFFMFDSLKIDSARRLESKRGSEDKKTKVSISISDNYVPNGAKWKSLLSQPIEFKRFDSTMAPLAFSKVSYFYSVDDSMVRVIEYEWKEVYYAESKKPPFDHTAGEQAFDAHFDSIYSYLTKTYGKPYLGNGISKLIVEGGQEWYDRNAEWKVAGANVRMFFIRYGYNGPAEMLTLRVLISWT